MIFLNPFFIKFSGSQTLFKKLLAEKSQDLCKALLAYRYLLCVSVTDENICHNFQNQNSNIM
jgi:hypothetical protein